MRFEQSYRQQSLLTAPTLIPYNLLFKPPPSPEYACSTPQISHRSPSTPHTHTIIFLHGRGSNATEFCSEIFESQASDNLFLTQLFPSVKWVFPSASLQHAHLENEDVHQWFDMTSVQNAQDHPEVQRPGLQHGAQYLLSIVEDEAGHVGLQKVILAGISQGCATAIHTLLSSGVCVGGFFGLCGWLPLADEVQQLSRAPGWGGRCARCRFCCSIVGMTGLCQWKMASSCWENCWSWGCGLGGNVLRMGALVE